MGRDRNRRLWEAFAAAGSTQYSLGQFSKKTSLLYWLTFGSVQQITRPHCCHKAPSILLIRDWPTESIFSSHFDWRSGYCNHLLLCSNQSKPQKEGKKKKKTRRRNSLHALIRHSFLLLLLGDEQTDRMFGAQILLSAITRYLFRTTTTTAAAFALFSDLETLKFGGDYKIGLYTQQDCTFEILKFGGDYKYGIHSETRKVGWWLQDGNAWNTFKCLVVITTWGMHSKILKV